MMHASRLVSVETQRGIMKSLLFLTILVLSASVFSAPPEKILLLMQKL